jgi:coenzyme F420 biosynthesis associated uncharacterized protein
VPRLIDPRVASAVAKRVAGDPRLSGSYLLERLNRDLEVAVPRSEELVAEASGIPAPAEARWGVIDRGAWAEANIKGMNTLLGPLGEALGSRLDSAPWPARTAQRVAVSAEVGALLGYISRRVLGQYDLLVSETEEAGGIVYFVGVNMVETERRFGFIPEEFAQWVAVHEITHRFQFEGVPWLRPKFLDLVHTYLSSVQMDAKGLARRFATAASRLMSRSTPPEERSPMYLLASPEQREILDRIQALMAVVEGHGNFVMDLVGSRVIPSFRQMRHVFQRRRTQQNLIQKAISNAIGLEMKLRQYEIGQRFCETVAEREGEAALAHLWADPDHFPSMTELREPERWLTRVAA